MSDNNAIQVPFIDTLRSVKIDSVVEVTESSGWSYHANYIGRTMHKAADMIEDMQKQIIELKQQVLDLDRECQTGEFQNAKIQG